MSAARPFSSLVLTTSFLLLSSTLLSGCAAGPDFVPPEAPSVTSFGPDATPKETASAKTSLGGIQRFEANGDVPAAWWTLFESASLNHLIEQAIQNNPSLEATRASLRAAEETASAKVGGFFPSVSGNANADRNKTRGSLKPYSLHSASVSVSYDFDLFGGTRRSVESAEAKAEAAKFELEAAYLTLTSNVVATALQEASLREQIVATKEIVAARQKQLDLTRKQYDAGAVPLSSVLSQESTLAASQAALPALENALAQTRHLLATLMGRFPSEQIDATFDFSSLRLPEKIPVSLPSKLVEQRPDVRASLALLKAANADVGVAAAAMLPQITLTGSYGVAASGLSSLFNPAAAVWGLGAGLAQPLFKGGELVHNRRAAEALFDKAAAEYRATVLAAFKDVADALKALETDALKLKAQTASERAAKENLDLVSAQYEAGAVGYLDLLSAQAAYQAAKINLIEAKAARLSDTAALFQALGGGWWNRKESIVAQ